MPRIRIRKTDNGTKPVSTFENAYKEVVDNNESVRCAAIMFNLNCTSLGTFIKKKKKAIEEGSTAPVTMGYRCVRRVFDKIQEKCMIKYIIKKANILFGLRPKEIRKLAFRMARKYELNMPDSWKEHEIAGKDWFSGFIKRNPEISVHGFGIRTNVFSTETIRLLMKTSAMKTICERKTKERKQVKKKVKQSEGKSKNDYQPKTKKYTVQCKENIDIKEENYFCLICLEPYNANQFEENWVQCMECHYWSHEKCTKQELKCVCHNCLSE